jgi:hypothetical protein
MQRSNIVVSGTTLRKRMVESVKDPSLLKSLYDLRFSQRWLRRVLSSGVKRHGVRWNPTDVSEEQVAYIFKVEEYVKHETSMKQVYSSTLQMEATCSSETSVDFQ